MGLDVSFPKPSPDQLRSWREEMSADRTGPGGAAEAVRAAGVAVSKTVFEARAERGRRDPDRGQPAALR